MQIGTIDLNKLRGLGDKALGLAKEFIGTILGNEGWQREGEAQQEKATEQLKALRAEVKAEAQDAKAKRLETKQKVAQAATWHVANGLSWDQLAGKKIDRLGRPDDAWFSPNELLMAHRTVAMASERAAAATVEPVTPSASQALGR